MAQIFLRDATIDRIEAITGKKFTRGGDRLINEMIDKLTAESEKHEQQ